MSDAVKWALLVAGIIAVIALVVAFGFGEYIDSQVIIDGCNILVQYAGNAFKSARGLINNFFFPAVYPALSFVIWWIILKPLATATIKVTISLYHYIFK